MDNLWIKEDLKTYKELYFNHRKTELALASYILSTARLLNEVANIEDESLYKYEKPTLWKPLKIFSRFFIEQVERAIMEDNPEKKNRIIMDIEDAVTRIITVYKNIVDGTSNADRLIFTSFSVETNVLDLSPKLTAFYSTILNHITEMIDPSGENYAFLLYPNLRGKAQAYHLFDERSGPEKVVIVYIPEYRMEYVETVLIFLIHEAFHVLTQEERNRRFRAGIMLQLMETVLGQFLFDETNLENSVKNNLESKWFGKILSEIKRYEEISPDDKCFYGKNMLKDQSQLLNDILGDIAGRDCKWDLIQELKQNETDSPLDDFAAKFDTATDQTKKIQKKLRWMFVNQITEKLIKLFLSLFREIYADIALLLFAPVTPSQYKTAFSESILYQHNDDTDFERTARTYIVAKIMSEFGDESMREEWTSFYLKREQEMQEILCTITKRPPDSSSDHKKDYFAIVFTGVIDKVSEGYFRRCAFHLKKRIAGIPEWEAFSGWMKRLLSGSREQILLKVFSGEEINFTNNQGGIYH